ncbi:serine hydrolase domain-containing protein [Solimonas marina]|uniref:Beta-lactamase family protein n=1 Tax=Solimonas marina TaxID=2714601 RepID=A0A970B6B1_9GAMM|nr:serine hydrolase domain-containing protein [Solimonas marina]NKF24262.1 beta-lactamase family protein [Solimonas marina]
MLKPLFASMTLAVASITAAAERPSDVATPNTAASTVFHEWLSAFNSGQRSAIQTFYATRLDDPDPAFQYENAEDTCGFDVVRIEAQTPRSLRVLLAEKCFPALQSLDLELGAPGTQKLKTFELRPYQLPPQRVIAALSSIADRLAQRDQFAGTLMIAHGSAAPWTRSWGDIDGDAKQPITADTPMFLASAGKMFTAVAVLQLVNAGKIDLDAPFGRYLTNYPNREMAKATIRQLLEHRGGTGDIGILGRDDGANRQWVRSIDDIIKLNGARGPDFPPGSKAEYSNYGFILLGAVIEKVTGQRYDDYIAEHIFKPAGMSRAGFPDLDHLQGVALGKTTFYGATPTMVSNRDVLPWRGASAGGGVASANDMRKFFDALRAGKLLPAKLLKLATTAGDTPWYGLGFVVNSGKHASWGHGGNSYGMDVATHYYPGIDTTFICLGTRDQVCNRLIYAWYFRVFGVTE